MWRKRCLVPRPHFSSRPKRFGSRGPCENVSRPFASDTSPKRIDREGLGKRRTGTRQGKTDNKDMQLVLQHCCKTSGKAILRVLPATFKPVKQQIRLLISLNEGGKTRNIPPGGGGRGTLRISGWGCAAGTLEPLTYTTANSAEFCFILE